MSPQKKLAQYAEQLPLDEPLREHLRQAAMNADDQKAEEILKRLEEGAEGLHKALSVLKAAT